MLQNQWKMNAIRKHIVSILYMGIPEKRIFISHLSNNLALQNGNRVREINLIFTQYGSNIRHTPHPNETICAVEDITK